MIVKHNKKGSSFRGAMAYYMHDKVHEKAQANGRYASNALKPQTSNRVDFTVTRNLVHADWELATDEMWYTAEHQNDLKRAAGIKPGKLCKDPVQTVSLSWHPEQKPTREQMIAAGDRYMKHMGLAGAQAIYIAHNDRPHAHLHIVYNRVHPETGMTFSDSFENARATVWSQDYMKEQGRVYWEPNPANENRRSLPHNVIDMARPYEHAFDADEQKRIDLFQLEKDLLKKAQAEERIAWFKEAKPEFRKARQEAYQEVRDEWKDHWKDYYKERDAEFKKLLADARAMRHDIRRARRDGRIVEAIGMESDINIRFAEHAAFYNDIKANMHAMQKEATREAQEVAHYALRVQREDSYKDVLTRQQAERDQMRALHREGELSKLGDTSIAEQLWAARGANDNANPFARPPTPANDVPSPATIEKVANDPAPVREASPSPQLVAAVSLTEELLQNFQREPMPQTERPARRGPTDLVATVLGSVANYIADQMSDFFSPPMPQELKQRGDAAERQQEARDQARAESDARILRQVNDAIRQTDEQQKQQARDDEWWKSRERRRDR